jgi:uncharacterized membrane protein
MKDLLSSLSLSSGAAIVAVCSALLAWPVSLVRPVVLRWAGALIVPFVLACALYWSPVWLGSNDVAQYSAWQFLVVGTWFLAGAVATTLMLALCSR